MSPAPKQKFNSKNSKTKNSSQTYLLCFTIDEGTDLTRDCSTKTRRNGVRRHKLTGKDGNINILDSRDFVQFFNQRVSDLNHVVVGKEVGHLARGVPRTYRRSNMYTCILPQIRLAYGTLQGRYIVF